MEQDRTPYVLLYHPKLAGPPASESPSHRQPDCQHHDAEWTADPSGLGYQPLPDRHQDNGCRDGSLADSTGCFSWRMELHSLAQSIVKLSHLFFDGSLVL